MGKSKSVFTKNGVTVTLGDLIRDVQDFIEEGTEAIFKTQKEQLEEHTAKYPPKKQSSFEKKQGKYLQELAKLENNLKILELEKQLVLPYIEYDAALWTTFRTIPEDNSKYYLEEEITDTISRILDLNRYIKITQTQEELRKSKEEK